MEAADWVSLSDQELLERRISTLGLRLEGTTLEPLIKQLYDELSAKGLLFHPPCHIGDEWFVSVGIPAIFVPFFLVNDRRRALERTMMLEVEGGTKDWFMKLIRHEAAHAYNYAYHLPRNKTWEKIFGQTSDDETPDSYRPRPFSRSYVVNLDDWYAQSHPDEDFAETFAVWLTPGLDWRTRYAGWKALQKLEYVDELMRSLAGKPPVHTPKYRVAEYDCLNLKLKTYYARKRKLYEDTYPDFYDTDLRQLFGAIRPTTLDQDLSKEMKTEDWKTEANVLGALGTLGYAAEHLAIFDDLDLVRQKLENFAPDVIFNLADQFKNNRGFDQNIVSFLEMQGVPFTGCSATGLVLCKHKGISKKILHYHRIRVPNFVVIPRGQRIVRPKQLKFPVLVKPVKEEASYGISQASFVETDEQFRERAAFIHEKQDADVIAEEYSEGREIYVGLMGNLRLTVFPIRELVFREVPPDEPKIATYRAKWDEEYRKRWGLQNKFAVGLEPALGARIEETCKRIYRLLTIDGYARIDLRLTPANEIYFIEANPNPILAEDEDFAQAAGKAGLPYPQLIDRIIRQGMNTLRD